MIAKRFVRALRLRCPRCGSRGVVAGWFALHAHCPRCGLALERGESHDYWLGAYAINLVVGETLALVVALIVLAIVWPNSAIAEWTGAAAAVMLPIALFPFSRLLWLAWDFSFRPPDEGSSSGHST